MDSSNTSLIEAIHKSLIETYSGDWLKTFIDKKGKLMPDQIGISVNSALSDVFNNFCVSLLKGEYVINENFFKEISDFESFLQTNFDVYSDEVEDEYNQKVYYSLIKERLINTISVFIKLYKSLFKLLETHDKYPKYDIINVSNPSLHKYLKEGADIEKIKFFSLIIELNRIDHFFNVSINTYTQLINFEQVLRSHTTVVSEYIPVLLEKIKFLKYKWEIRQRTLFKENNSIKGSIIDNELSITTDSEVIITDKVKILEWQNYIESHYEVGDWGFKINSAINKLNILKPETLTILELHLLIKYHKDVSGNYKTLKDVVNIIKGRRDKEQNEIFVYNKIYNYALNNQFSLLIQQKNIDDNEVENLKEEIEAFQIKCKTDNFFVEYKYIYYLIQKAEHAYNNRKELDNISSIKNIIETLDVLIPSCNEKLIWSKNHYNQLFQLPFEECKVTTNLDDLPYVYYPSSFVLPLPLPETEKSFETLKQRYNRIGVLVSSMSSLSNEFSIIKGIKKDLKASDLKSIEVLGIFTALIAFIFGAISSYNFIETPYQAILFMGVFALSLMLFVSFLLCFVRVKFLKKRWYLIFIPVVLLVSNWFFLGHLYDKDYAQIKTENNELIQNNDSLLNIKFYPYKVSLDSLMDLNNNKLRQLDSLIMSSKNPKK